MRFALLAGIALAVFATACSPPAPPAPSAAEQQEAIKAESAKLTAFLDARFEEELQFSPEWLTDLGRKEQYDKLDDRSEAAMAAQLAWRRNSVEQMKATISYDLLDSTARTSWDMWVDALAREELADTYRRHSFVFGRSGAHAGLPNFLINFHKVDTEADMKAYASRLRGLMTVMDQLIERAELAKADGIRMPRFAYERSIQEAKAVITGAPFDNGPDSPLWADAKAKIAALKAAGVVDDAQVEALTHDARESLKGYVKPGYERVIAWLEADIANAPSGKLGASTLPDGANYYAAALKLQTTTDMTAEEIHAIGLKEVERIRAEMEAIRVATGFKGDLKAFFAFVKSDPQFFYPDTDKGRADYIALSESYLSAMEAKLPEYFGILPKADLVVRRVEAFREEKGGAQHYVTGSPDGARPGVFYAHLSDMKAMPKNVLESIAYHEGLPGHHMQLSIAQELTGLPVFRTQAHYGAFIEGWALYTEALAKEMGFYQDPYSDFGRLTGEMWRAIRLVVDTGIHAKGWTEEEAVAYCLENSPQTEGSVRSEVRRYISWPGQATTYKIGMLKLQELRDFARAELGERFTYPAFHDVVLGGGSQPLPVVEARVKEWVAATKAEPVGNAG